MLLWDRRSSGRVTKWWSRWIMKQEWWVKSQSILYKRVRLHKWEIWVLSWLLSWRRIRHHHYLSWSHCHPREMLIVMVLAPVWGKRRITLDRSSSNQVWWMISSHDIDLMMLFPIVLDLMAAKNNSMALLKWTNMGRLF